MAEMNEQQISTLTSYEELKLRMASAKKNNNGNRRISGSLEAASAMSVRDRLAALQKSDDRKRNKNRTILYVDGIKKDDDEMKKKTTVPPPPTLPRLECTSTSVAQEKKKGQSFQPHKSSVVSVSVQPPAPAVATNLSENVAAV